MALSIFRFSVSVIQKWFVAFFVFLTCLASYGQNAHVFWDVASYPDEVGFQQRMQPMLTRIAGKGFGRISLAQSRCPDTGLPVFSWAVEGEEIISPYTGRRYTQGATGYFGPKARNEQGQIIDFGGDPLKYDLPPATAALLINPVNQEARAFLSIPGNLRQQYHFAAKNWARFYPLLKDTMGLEWLRSFHEWVGSYSERRRPSDGAREHAPLSVSHNLVGEQGMLLGGNPLNGGTENHKIMWRTSALLYSQLFPDTALISGYRTDQVQKLTKEMLRNFLKRLLITGNGEYDSQVYYPHSIEGFLNLYDFSPDEETRQLAKFALDYYFLTYGMKTVEGTIAGAQKRGYLAGSAPGEMETMMWGFFNNTSRSMDQAVATIQQATTTYRPNRIIYNIVNKKVQLPFEIRMNRPFYHMDKANAFAETFYGSESFSMGNIQMTMVDNPNQQMVWSLVAKGLNGPLCFSGGHPMRRSTSGHSPYTQTLQAGSALMVITAPTKMTPDEENPCVSNYSKAEHPSRSQKPKCQQGENFEIKNRRKYAAQLLHDVQKPADDSPAELEKFWDQSMGSASTWFFYPAALTPVLRDGIWFLEANQTLLALIPLAGNSYNVTPLVKPDMNLSSELYGFFKDYHLLVFPGELSGYVLEAAEKSAYGNLENFMAKVTGRSPSAFSNSSQLLKWEYTSLAGYHMALHYQPHGLRCHGYVNHKVQKWDDFIQGAVYQSPYVNIKNGIMKVTDGHQGYEVNFKGNIPIYRTLDVKTISRKSGASF